MEQVGKLYSLRFVAAWVAIMTLALSGALNAQTLQQNPDKNVATLLANETTIAAAALVFQGTGQTQPKPMGEVRIGNNVPAYNEHGRGVDFPVFVTLYKDGQAIRTTELPSTVITGGRGSVTWNGVPTGSLEVHFEARGYGKVIKRIIVVKGTRVSVRVDAMDKKDELWGAGPSLFELQKRIETLEAEVAALKKGR
jgi:hypothetical protein